ncbi:MAG: phosphonate ABC transporter, permease protein PhnE [Nocardioides sp.]
MSLTETAAPTAPQHNRPDPPSKLPKTLGLLGMLGLVLLAIRIADAPWTRVLDIPDKMQQYGALMSAGVFRDPTEVPYDGYWATSFELMVESLQIAWIGTVIGALFSFPIAFLAASNISPAPVSFLARQFLNSIRAIPEIILAIAIMLPIFGLGPLAGALALGVHSIGTLGKLTSEAIEGIVPGPVEAVRATGSSPLQTVRWAVIPQVLPDTVAFWLYRFEVNIRASAVLGVLGAGGIGSLLSQLFRHREWERIGIALVVVIVVTIAVDQVSAAVRRRIIHGSSVRSVANGSDLA